MAAPFISVGIAGAVEPLTGDSWELILILLPAFLSWGAFGPVVQGMVFYLVFGSEFFLWSFIDELLVVVLQHWVPFATFSISSLATLWGYAISRNLAHDYGDTWDLIVFTYAA